MSDPRVSGDVYITWNIESGASSSGDYTMWGATWITNDQGTWEGEYTGFVEPNGRRNAMLWMEGRGAYEGLTYIEHMEGSFPEVTFTGLVYPGSIPPTMALGVDGPLAPAPPLPEDY